MQLEEAVSERADEEMDVSDSDNETDLSMRKKPRYEEERANPNNIFSLKVRTSAAARFGHLGPHRATSHRQNAMGAGSLSKCGVSINSI